jgi:hypothetical protein
MRSAIKKQLIHEMTHTLDHPAKMVMRDGNSYSVFGILCNLYHREHPNTFWSWVKVTVGEETATKYFFNINGKEYDRDLPPQVIKWSGLDDRSIVAIRTLNDDASMALWEIAKFVAKIPVTERKGIFQWLKAFLP